MYINIHDSKTKQKKKTNSKNKLFPHPTPMKFNYFFIGPLNIKNKQGNENDMYTEIFDSVKENLELNNIFKELYQLKTCVHLLMSEEQYAAVKYTGKKIPD